ncbi:TlpA disulfide reductase family protein [Rhizosaccharibacter radicis]|uniref:TlpA family protein disulfide reductase n=1 Tax=Rhizosaccharibacter radicis TaxID=2782605 RepID=A0ABT1W061_9PROT|nr:TlpA family protein disulfide reductase [Acetobacteraceae bacterium KSS12]
MQKFVRRGVLAAGGTLLGALTARKWLPAESRAEEPPPAGPHMALPSAIVAHPPTALPPFGFTDENGRPRSLADYKGRPVVLNFWATWCVPCVSELPALSRLAAATAPDGVAVLTVSVDRGGVDAVQRFFRSHAIVGLPVLSDPHSAALSALNIDGIPTTLLVDREGRERARAQGAIDWNQPDSRDVLRRLIG